MMNRIALAVLVVLTASLLWGCSGMSAVDPKAKDANVQVIEIGTPWGRQRGLYINLDKGVIPAGGITISPDGTVQINVSPPPPPTPPNFKP